MADANFYLIDQSAAEIKIGVCKRQGWVAQAEIDQQQHGDVARWATIRTQRRQSRTQGACGEFNFRVASSGRRGGKYRRGSGRAVGA